MEEPIIVIVPEIQSVSFSVNPVLVNAQTVLTVKVSEVTKALYPEEKYVGEFYTGE